jgi:signal transduction histidine kinase
MEAVGQLTGGMAHDFNNLLGSMLLNLDFLRDEVAGSETGENMLNTLTSAVERGASLTQRLLAFSRQQVLDARVLDATTLIRDMESLLRHTLPATIRIDMNLQSSPAMVNVDRH